MGPRRCLNCGNPITDDMVQYQLFCSSWCRYEIEEKTDKEKNEYVDNGTKLR